MPQEQKSKLDVFVQTIMEESSADVGSILDELERKTREAIEKTRAALLSEAARYKAAKSSEIRSREGRRVNARMTENKQKLLLFRESCANEVFSEVNDRLARFTHTPEYLDYLKTKLRLAFSKLGHGYAAKLFLRAEDMRFAQDMLEVNRGVTLTVSQGRFHLGGFHLVCPARSIRIDMSFDTALEDMLGRFAELSGMQVE